MTSTKPRRQPADVRRNQILDAAQSVMLRDGLHHATVAEIAGTAGLGKGTVYLQFDSKQELIAGLRHRYVARIEEEVRSAIPATGSASEKLRAMVRSFAIASTRDPDLHHLLFQEAGMDEAAAFAPLRATFAEVIRGGDFEVPNLDLAIEYAFGGLHAALVAVVHATPKRRTRAVSEIADLVARTLGPTSADRRRR